MNFQKLLQDLLGGSNEVRAQTEAQIENMKQVNLPQFLLEMTNLMKDESIDPAGRSMAANLFKNAVSDTRSEQHNSQLANIWSHLPEEQRNHLKGAILPVFASPIPIVRSGAAQIIAQLACIELPLGMWSNIIELLLNNVKTGDQHTKVATLECLGILCQQINPQFLESKSTIILNTIVSSFQASPPIEVCREAMKALLLALKFVKNDFESKERRDYIMNFVCQGARADDAIVRKRSVQCLVKVAEEYYRHLGAYIAHIFEITTLIIKKDAEEIAMQAVEFWSTLSEMEGEMMLMEEEDCIPPDVTCFRFIVGQDKKVGAYPHLVPILFEALTKQAEDPEDEDLCLAVCATACLQLLAKTVRNPIVPSAMQFVTPMIASGDWRQREAAAMGFGCVMNGPEGEDVSRLVHEGLRTFIGLVSTDPHLKVRDTSAWTIAQIATHHPHVVPDYAKLVIETCGTAMANENSHFAAMSCNALSKVILALAEMDAVAPLDGFFLPLMEKLSMLTERPDASDNNLRFLGFDAMTNLVEAVSDSCLENIFKLVPVFVEKLERTQAQGGGEESVQVAVYLCVLLQFMTNRLNQQIGPHAERLLKAYYAVLSMGNGITVEECLDAIAALITEFPEILRKCHGDMQRIIVAALQKWNEPRVLVAGIGLLDAFLSPIAGKAYDMDQGVFLNTVVGTLLDNLKRPQLANEAKPPIIGAFGDVAVGAGKNFVVYFEPVMAVLQIASNFEVKDMSDEDLVDHLLELRESVLDTYEMVISSMTSCGTHGSLLKYLPKLFEFLRKLDHEVPLRTAEIVCHVVGLVGDVAKSFGAEAKPYLAEPWVTQLVRKASSHSPDTKKAAKYAQKQLSRVLG
mmetsp:Transcript_13724/g.54304  ORF Transcript_13724/g.54304 Transcript_13724/m.54304 type:complete len:857 (+) Transcript_13724:123-2693(+)|eukprot:CAMPEP_0114617666 /NCGR_PEP_ID=MMETSP0168-20121206/7312_1 /TAXON_ID=95228 ORGANISM="Vannella sp., Strain DIVA3 517/6/12" /NCGR_SAMPLE_ID=MMETSP0168 /ASSEMBLY_ACC=CAM_ASM_000044 /LENGTH=856 /DNA_ID=CAMNT_0001828803 /DNA_START=100 /DNA_END=2670 /DNA_ORIENTATION=-